eukprot:m.303224 g.303224  ORF g.303224 m.303224 type:complete len:796 (-) comp15755_c0_seq1:228-2615(-)
MSVQRTPEQRSLGERFKALILKRFLLRSFWAWPTMSIALNFIMAWGLCMIHVDSDSYLELRPPQYRSSVLFFSGTPEGARAVLSLVAGTAISIVTLTFSLTVLSLQLASFNYTPRILDEFLKDPTTKLILGTYLGTYAYCFTVTWNIRNETENYRPYVPIVAVNFVIIHMVAMLLVFVQFIHYFVNNMRIERVLTKSRDAAIHIARNHMVRIEAHDDVDGRPPTLDLPDVPPHALRVKALHSGYITKWTLDEVFEYAVEWDAVIRYTYHLGHFVTEGTLICWVWARDGDYTRLAKALRDAAGEDKPTTQFLTEIIDDGLTYSEYRIGDHDISLSVRQLTDIAIRALSPGVNDPQTAIQVLDALSFVFVELSTRSLDNIYAYELVDESGNQCPPTSADDDCQSSKNSGRWLHRARRRLPRGILNARGRGQAGIRSTEHPEGRNRGSVKQGCRAHLSSLFCGCRAEQSPSNLATPATLRENGEDSQGACVIVRVCAPAIEFVYLLSACMDPIRAYGHNDINVARRCLYFLADVGSLCSSVCASWRVERVVRHIEQWKTLMHEKFGESSLEYASICDAANHALHLISNSRRVLVSRRAAIREDNVLPEEGSRDIDKDHPSDKSSASDSADASVAAAATDSSSSGPPNTSSNAANGAHLGVSLSPDALDSPSPDEASPTSPGSAAASPEIKAEKKGSSSSSTAKTTSTSTQESEDGDSVFWRSRRGRSSVQRLPLSRTAKDAILHARCETCRTPVSERHASDSSQRTPRDPIEQLACESCGRLPTPRDGDGRGPQVASV